MLQTVDVVVRTERHRLDVNEVPLFPVVRHGKDIFKIWIPVGLNSGL